MRFVNHAHWILLWVAFAVLSLFVRDVCKSLTDPSIRSQLHYEDETAHIDPFPEDEDLDVQEAYDQYCWDMRQIDWEAHCRVALLSLGPPPPDYISGRSPAWALVRPTDEPAPSKLKSYQAFKSQYKHEPDEDDDPYQDPLCRNRLNPQRFMRK